MDTMTVGLYLELYFVEKKSLSDLLVSQLNHRKRIFADRFTKKTVKRNIYLKVESI